jgi:putative serine esterase DUF676
MCAKRSAIILLLVLGVLFPLAAPALGRPLQELQVAILRAGMAGGHSFRIDLATTGLDPQMAEPAELSLDVQVEEQAIHVALPLRRMPSRFPVVLDLARGAIRLAGVTIGSFQPVPPFQDNVRIPIEAKVSEGASTAVARAAVLVPLPTVIVPGYFNELGGPDGPLLAALARQGFADGGPAPTVFWYRYASGECSLDDGARKLAAYVRQTVLQNTYASKINVVGYSLGGLFARWNVAYDVDGWGTLVNRLLLVGVPNEGAVHAYVYAFYPILTMARTPGARSVLPTFPFVRAAEGQPWDTPSGSENRALAALNERPIPENIRLFVLYGSADPGSAGGLRTYAGITGSLPDDAVFSYGTGDGVVLVESAQGLPFRGGSGVAALARAVRVNLGAVSHRRLLTAGADDIAAILTDRSSGPQEGASTAPFQQPVLGR